MTTAEKMTREYERAMDELGKMRVDRDKLRVECNKLRMILGQVFHDEHAMERLKVEVERLRAEVKRLKTGG